MGTTQNVTMPRTTFLCLADSYAMFLVLALSEDLGTPFESIVEQLVFLEGHCGVIFTCQHLENFNIHDCLYKKKFFSLYVYMSPKKIK